MTTENKITINEIEHDVNKFTKEQQYMVAQIRNLNVKLNNIKFELDQVNVAKESFSNALIKSIQEVNDETKNGNDT